MKQLYSLRRRYLPMIFLLLLGAVTIGRSTPVFAQTVNPDSSAVASSLSPAVGDQVEVTIVIDMSNVVVAPDNALYSFTGTLTWNPNVLAYHSNSGILAGFFGNFNSTNGKFNGIRSGSGATGSFTVLTITFDVIGSGSGDLGLTYSAMAGGPPNFISLLPLLNPPPTADDIQVGALSVSIGYFLAERDGDMVNFTWQTATETGNAGFNLLTETDGGLIQINEALIASTVIDSVVPTGYSYRAVTSATLFHIEEVRITGEAERFGPFALGTPAGTYVSIGVEQTPVIWLPMVRN